MRLFLFFLAVTVHAANITAIWGNDGEDKVTRDELRVSLNKQNLTGLTKNKVWNGSKISLYGAHNEVISFQLTLEAARVKASGVSILFNVLTGPNDAKIRTSGTDPFNYVNRPIELFVEKYVQIQGLSFFGYQKEISQIPIRFRAASGQWVDRPDHDKFYPDALMPIEAQPKFDVLAGQNQSIWCDIYIAKNLPAGLYKGSLKISEGTTVTRQIPVELTVAPFALPDAPTAPNLTSLEIDDITHRYVGPGYINWQTSGGQQIQAMTDKYFQMFHRHKMALAAENECAQTNQPCASSVPRLNGQLYTSSFGYDGPGVNTPAGVFSIGTYGTWPNAWKTDQAQMTAALKAWDSWFKANIPGTDLLLYLQDEPPTSAYPQLETWAQWVQAAGTNVMSAATVPAVNALSAMPSMLLPIQPGGVGNCPIGQTSCNLTQVMQAAHDAFHGKPGQQFWEYNDYRPGVGTFMIEGDGTDMRTFGWAQWKMKVDRWFYWYANLPNGDWLNNATTWGTRGRRDPSLGLWGDDAPSNGNGLIVYPGSDLQNPGSSLHIKGPLASIRMKNWRRGIQDADYLEMANKIDPKATAAIVAQVMPRALWEYPVQDPGWAIAPISWSSDPDVWENARYQLGAIISRTASEVTPPPCPCAQK